MSALEDELAAALSRVRLLDGRPYIARRDLEILSAAAERTRRAAAAQAAQPPEVRVYVTMPEQVPPPVHVDVAAPIVNVEAPLPVVEQQPRNANVLRDKNGRITGVEYR